MSNVQHLCEECRRERKQFSESGNKHSPGCTGLWRLAISNDNEDAWFCIKTIFEPLVYRFCNVAVSHTPQISGLSQQDLPDIVQDVWHNLLRYKRNHPVDALDLVAKDDLSRIIGLIKTTVKNRVLELCRKPEGKIVTLNNGDDRDGDHKESASIREQPKSEFFESTTDTLLDVIELLKEQIKTAQEYIVAEMIFLQQMKPQDICDLHADKFENVAEVNQVRQNLIRRIRGDTTRRKAGGSASLEFRLDIDEVHMNLFEPCPFDEGILIDYLNGHVNIEVRTAIEALPSCVQAAAALKADLLMLQPYLRQIYCPASTELVAFQERRLSGNDQLRIAVHLRHCQYCREELDMLSAIDSVPIEPPSSLARRIYELFFRPATHGLVPVRGEGTFRTIGRTPQIELLLRTTKAVGKQRTWTLYGRLRDEGDQPLTKVEAITLQDVEEKDCALLSTMVDESGTFTLKSIDTGNYCLTIITPDEEIVLREFKVGESL